MARRGFRGNHYDLKHTIELILTSRAYQLPAMPATEVQPKNFAFRGPLVRRLSAEQFVDTAAQLTGLEDHAAAARLNFATLSGKNCTPISRINPRIPNGSGATNAPPKRLIRTRSTSANW
jgi:hypothetical protein